MVKYEVYVRWTNSNKEYLSSFTTETDKGVTWLYNDIANSYERQFRYLLDGKLIGIDIGGIDSCCEEGDREKA
ncbi:hypothetical protein COI95_07340 [Bacillus cereus]|nr:hypothetical protein COI95_07340 [Bacillus cereus]